jgi:hypothetical protein
MIVRYFQRMSGTLTSEDMNCTLLLVTERHPKSLPWKPPSKPRIVRCCHSARNFDQPCRQVGNGAAITTHTVALLFGLASKQAGDVGNVIRATWLHVPTYIHTSIFTYMRTYIHYICIYIYIHV